MIPDLDNYQLGQTAEDLILSSSEDCREIALALAGQARQSLAIFTQDLDGALYDTEPFVAAVAGLATTSRHSRVRVLTRDTERPAKHGHRLIELSRRLPTSIEIRQCHEEYHSNTEAFLVADVEGLLHRKHAGRYEATANFHAPKEARMLLQLFDDIWEKSIVPTELRRLDL